MRYTIGGFILAVCAAASAHAAPVQWTVGSGGNGHYYEFVDQRVDWTTALGSAASMSHLGLTGYLATITSAAEQAFLSALYPGNIGPVWLGGSDAATEGTWQWVTGPEAGTTFWQNGTTLTYANWNGGEPNNLGNEDYLHGWWSGDRWNDIPGTLQYSYLVEYGPAAPSAIPVPAALPLLLSALGVTGLLARRRRT